MVRFKAFFFLLSLWSVFSPASAQGFDPERDITASYSNGSVILTVPHIAHATEISVSLKPGSTGKLKVALPRPSGVDSLGIDYWAGTVRIPVKGEGLKDPVTLMVSYMSCLEGEGGQCFPPVDKELKVKAADIPGDTVTKIEEKIQETPTVNIGTKPAESGTGNAAPPATVTTATTGTDNGATAVTPDASGATTDSTSSRGGLLAILILFFLGGIGASLTPCVLPMIPITMAVIGARSASKLRGLVLGIVLTQGMALTYTLLGVIAALTGSVFGQFAQHPGFLIPVSIIFSLFAISLLGAFELKLPDSLTNKLQSRGPRKGLMGAFITGLVLGPLSAPCVGPLIGTAIVDIGANQLVFEGALKMFIFAQGMGVLFIIGGTAVSALPKSGDWLTRFKQTLGVIILAFAVWNIRLIVPEWANYAMWSTTLLITSGIFGAFEAADGLIGNIRKGFALFAFAFAVLLGIRGTEHFLNIPLLPSGGSAKNTEHDALKDLWIEHDYEEAQDKARTEGKLVLVDTFTDWCAQCKELDEKTWPDPAIMDWIRKNAIAVRIDTEKVRPDLAKPLGVRAYPTIILMTADGKEIRRINGFHKPEKMLEWLKQMS